MGGGPPEKEEKKPLALRQKGGAKKKRLSTIQNTFVWVYYSVEAMGGNLRKRRRGGQ